MACVVLPKGSYSNFSISCKSTVDYSCGFFVMLFNGVRRRSRGRTSERGRGLYPCERDKLRSHDLCLVGCWYSKLSPTPICCRVRDEGKEVHISHRSHVTFRAAVVMSLREGAKLAGNSREPVNIRQGGV